LARTAGAWLFLLALLLPNAAARAAEPLGLLSGTSQPQPVQSLASARSDIVVADDGAVSGSVYVSGTVATAVRIREGEIGDGGPLVLDLVAAQLSTWSAPRGARLSAPQLLAFKAGRLYVTVLTRRRPTGELRVQLRPPSTLLTDSEVK
jgi:hypothetical protein